MHPAIHRHAITVDVLRIEATGGGMEKNHGSPQQPMATSLIA
ncbi:hypothetical protein CSB93_1923 [Pseudomonas paraeruginosa]|uniref:Uncharacterized protein n=1 Tax=Pseudomonas paraeruginosa TaxID=2994495 RepID=A0A2R3J1L4_9PSED|nr:hypothetical protein CSB93_1923 [Pseudomonas paraeruginosa]